MNQRAYDRLAAGFAVLLLAVLATATYYLAAMADRSPFVDQGRQQRHEPDYFVEHVELTRLNPQGQPLYRMKATRLNHYPDDDSIDFVQPALTSLDPAKPLVTITADRGKSTSGGVETHLYDNVVLTRAPFGEAPQMRVQSQYMLLLSEQDIARTDQPVHITYGDSVLDGTGMEFNNDTRQLELFSKVRGTWTGVGSHGKGGG